MKKTSSLETKLNIPLSEKVKGECNNEYGQLSWKKETVGTIEW